MSFADNLWGKQDLLHNRFKKKMECYTNVLTVISRYKDGLREFAKTLKWINDKGLQLSEQSSSTLDKATEELKTFLLDQMKLFNESCDYLDKSVLEPYKAQIDRLVSVERERYNDLKKSLTKFIDAESFNQKTKAKFYHNAKIAETAKIDAEKIKMSLTNQIDKDKSLQRADTLIASARDFEKAYIASLKAANEARVDYINKATVAFFNYQNSEKEFGEGLSQVLTSHIGSARKTISEQLRIYESIEAVIDKINLENDLTKLFNENRSEESPPIEIPFEPYPTIVKLDDHNYSPELIFEVANTFHNNFTGIYKNFKPEEEKEKLTIKHLSMKIFTSNKGFFFSTDEKDKLMQYLKKGEHRKTFLQVLNKQRVHGKFLINKRLFDDITDILKLILDLSQGSNDYESPESCVILSQTFHIEDEKGGKYYLIKRIENHPLLTSTQFWEGLIDLVIEKEKDKQRLLNASEEEIKGAMGNIVFSQLLPYTNNMVEFNIEKSKIMELIDHFSTKFQLDDNFKTIIVQNIDEKDNEMKVEREKMKEIEMQKIKEKEKELEKQKEIEKQKEMEMEKEKEEKMKKEMEKEQEKVIEPIQEPESLNKEEPPEKEKEIETGETKEIETKEDKEVDEENVKEQEKEENHEEEPK